MTNAGLNGFVVSIFIDNIKIMALKKWYNWTYEDEINICILDSQYEANQFLLKLESRAKPRAKDYQTISAHVY